jgi:hypothetical protein
MENSSASLLAAALRVSLILLLRTRSAVRIVVIEPFWRNWYLSKKVLT